MEDNNKIRYKNWEERYTELKSFLDKNGRFPAKNEYPELERWIKIQQTDLGKGKIDNEKKEKLDQLRFIWSNQEKHWEDMFLRLVKYAALNRFEPDAETDKELYSWYGTQKTYLNKGKLTENRKEKIQSIVFEGPANRNKWFELYTELVAFRALKPQEWPGYDRNEPDTLESRLANFCQTIRKRYRENSLEKYWFDKFAEINFNFGGNKDNWIEIYNEVKEIIKDRESVSIKGIGEKAYNWIYRYKKYYDKGVRLTPKKRKLIEELNLDRFFESWDCKFTKVKDWLTITGKFPTRLSNNELHTWLASQRIRFQTGFLSESEIEKLNNIGFDLLGLGNEKDELRWKEQFKHLELFLKLNPARWPSFYSKGDERILYSWCQTQRQAQAGTSFGGRRKPLAEWKVQKLNTIGFQWNVEEKHEKAFILNCEKIKEFRLNNPTKNIPAKIDGRANPLYLFLVRQKCAYAKGNYSAEHFDRLLKIGIDLSKL
jgi:hypothetical protein